MAADAVTATVAAGATGVATGVFTVQKQTIAILTKFQPFSH